MKRSLRTLVLVAGMASATALGCNFALAEESSAKPAPVQAQGEHRTDCREGKHQRGHGGHRDFAKLIKKLGLTEQQTAQAKAVFKDNREQAKPLFAGLRTEKHLLHEMIQSGSADEAAIRAQSAKVSSFQADLAVQRAKGAKQLMALLTPEQQTKFKALQAQREQKMHKSRGHREHGEK
jgi:periplasmic protein CpxP/Spy